MPIFDQSYRSYSGTLRRRFRWGVMVGQELRVLFSRRMFIFLVLLGNFHFLLRIFQVFISDVLVNQPGFFEGLQGELEEVGAWVYFDFLRMQSPLIFLTLIYAGSGLICNDFRNNLTEIYFSKPINWRDYVAGKVLALVCVGLSLSALPALFLALMHLTFKPSYSALLETLALTPGIIVFSLLFVGSFALVILASSTLVNSSRFAAVAVFMLTLVNIAVGGMLAGLTGATNYLVLAFPVSLNNVGEALFREHRYVNPIDVPWPWSAIYIGIVCVIAFAIVCAKARRAETGR
jgi:ABC-type transport system involved in multi-copper enzyme maturation permease subunit